MTNLLPLRWQLQIKVLVLLSDTLLAMDLPAEVRVTRQERLDIINPQPPPPNTNTNTQTSSRAHPWLKR